MKTATTKPASETNEMQFDSPVGSASNSAGVAPSAASEKQKEPKQKAKSKPRDQQEKKAAAAGPSSSPGIHATECVINSECTFTPGCRGRLKATNPVGGKIQVYCSKCHVFAEGQRPANGAVAASGIQLFDRTKGKATNSDLE